MNEHRTIPMPVEVTQKQCPTCQWNLAFAWAKLDLFPYVHTDICLKCLNCKKEYRFGVPFDHHAGMTQMVFGSDFENALACFQHNPSKDCPFCAEAMPMTKYINHDTTKPPITQYKCPTCYFIANTLETEILANASTVDPNIRKRLEDLGYIDADTQETPKGDRK